MCGGAPRTRKILSQGATRGKISGKSDRTLDNCCRQGLCPSVFSYWTLSFDEACGSQLAGWDKVGYYWLVFGQLLCFLCFLVCLILFSPSLSHSFVSTLSILVFPHTLRVLLCCRGLNTNDGREVCLRIHQAATQGNINAQNLMAHIYMQTLNIGFEYHNPNSRNPFVAVTHAMEGLGHVESPLEHTESRKFGAFLWSQKSAEQGNAKGQFLFAECWNKGYGVLEHCLGEEQVHSRWKGCSFISLPSEWRQYCRHMALEWYQKAAAQGFRQAIQAVAQFT